MKPTRPMTHRLFSTPLCCGLLAAALATPALAHRFWVLPSATVLSGSEPWVTFDAAISNNLFFADHHAPELEMFTATGPDGQKIELRNAAKGRYRSTFDIPLEMPGTYVIGADRLATSARWEEDGEQKRFRGTPESFQQAGLADKPGIEVNHNHSRVLTFVTLGEPDTTALKPQNKGLEIDFSATHPNDLFAKETATFKLLHHGQPAKDVEVTVVRGDDRYRSESGEMTLKTDAEGVFTVTWPEAGRYWLNASAKGDTAEDGKATQSSSYTAVFEVLPQ